VVLEANLYDLVTKPKHYGMLSSHPLLNVHNLSRLSEIIECSFISHFGVAVCVRGFPTCRSVCTISCIDIVIFKVGSEMLKKSDLFLKFFWKIEK
jgi:hypothetical protein